MYSHKIEMNDNIIQNISKYVSYYGTTALWMIVLNESFIQWYKDHSIALDLYKIQKDIPKSKTLISFLHEPIFDDGRFDLYFEFKEKEDYNLFKLSWS